MSSAARDRRFWSRKRLLRWCGLAVGGYLLLCGVAGVFLAEGALRPSRVPNDPGARERLATMGQVEDVEVRSAGARHCGARIQAPEESERRLSEWLHAREAR